MDTDCQKPPVKDFGGNAGLLRSTARNWLVTPNTEGWCWVYKVWASFIVQLVKNLPAVQKIQVQSLGQKDLLEKETATHSSFLAWRIPWTEEPGRLPAMGSQELDRT